MAAEMFETERASGDRAYEMWHDRLAKSLAWRQSHWNGDDAWKRALRLVRGDHWSEGQEMEEDLFSDTPRDLITVNVTGSTVEDFLPFLIRRHPEFTIRPRRPESVEAAVNQRNLLNYLWREKNMTRQMRRAVKDSVIIGHGIVKTGYRFELEEGALRPGVRINYNDAIREEEPWIRRINPLHFVFDPDAPEHDLESARWCAEILFRPVQDVLEDKRYKKSVIKRIKNGELSLTTHLSFLSDHATPNAVSSLTADEQRSQELAVIWEVWDKRFSKRLVFLDGVTEPVIEEDWPYPYLDGFPYVTVPFIDLQDEHYPLGMVRFIEDQQMELNRIRTKEFADHRRTGVLITAAKNHISATELSKATSGSALEILLHDGAPGDSPLQAVSMPTELFKSEALQRTIMEDIRTMTGADALTQGGSLKSRTSATEVNARAQFFGLKLEDKVEKIDLFFQRVARQVLQHTQANMKTNKLVLPLGVDAARVTAEHFSSLTPDAIRGEFDLDLATVSADRVDRSVDRQQRMQVMQIVLQQLQLLSQAGQQVDVAALIGWVLETFDIKDIERFFPQGLTVDQPLVEGGGLPVGVNAPPPDPAAESQQRNAVGPLAGLAGALSGGAVSDNGGRS